MASVAKREWKGPKGEDLTAWVVRYADNKGKRRLKTFSKKKDADRYRTKVETEVEAGTHVAASESVTVDAALDLWLDNCEARAKARDRLRPRTVRNFRCTVDNHIRPFLGKKILIDLTFRSLQAWIDDLAFDKVRPRRFQTLRNVAACMSLTLKHAVHKGYVGKNVLRDEDLHIPGRKVVRVEIPTKAEIRKMLDASGVRTGRGGVARYLRALLHTAVFAGLRQGELRALTWDHVDFEHGLIKVRVAADNLGHVDEPKSAAGIRDVPLAHHLAVELKTWKLASRPNPANLVFTGERGTMVHPAAIDRSWHRLQHRITTGGKGQAKQPREKYHFHALRHVCASLLIEAGLPPKRIQYIMGHASISMTFDRYGHLFEDPDSVQSAMARIGRDLVIA